MSGLLDWIGHALATLAAVLGLGGAAADAPIYQGYIEGEYLRMAAPVAGRLETLHVARGDQVDAGTPLFAIDLTEVRAERDRAAAALAQAKADLENLTKGKRQPEMEVIAAQKTQAEAALRLAEAQLQRQEALVARGASSKERLDEARSTYNRDRARVAELTAQLEVGTLPAREDEIRAAQAAVRMAEAALIRTEQQLADSAPTAPVHALVEDTFYNEGEWVPASSPVVSLLPPDRIKIRFYVPEPRVGALAMGQQVRFQCDGCRPDQTARISFIAPRAEYTPPVIYSTESRAKLVFRVEAKPDSGAARLHAGQPVDVQVMP